MRVINQILSGFPADLIDQIDSHTCKYVRPLVKAPMILILLVCGVDTGLNLTAFTFLGELLQSGTFTESLGLILFLGTVAGGSSVFLLLTLNFVMARYEQLDALPIY